MRQSQVTITFSLEQTAQASRLARHRIQQALGDDAPIELLRDTLLLTSELVTNATTHTDGGCDVSMQFDPQRQHLRIEVSDTSHDVPQPKTDPRSRVGGLGLQLVSTLASAWGTIVNSGGKTVWFELAPDDG